MIQTLKTLKPQFSLGISGEVHGAGSSTIAKLMAEILNFDYYYAGILYRKAAVKKGYAKDLQDSKGITAFASQYVVEHPEIDIEIEKEIIEKAIQGGCLFEGKAVVILAKAGKLPVFESKKKKYSLKSVKSPKPLFTVLLTCDRVIAAQRVLTRKMLLQQKGFSITSREKNKKIIKQLTIKEIEAQIEDSTERMRAARANWDKLYGLSELEKNQGAFDLIIDTSYLSPEKITNKILDSLANTHLRPYLSH